MDEVHAAVHLAHRRRVQEVDGRQVEVRDAGRRILLRGDEDLKLLRPPGCCASVQQLNAAD